MLNIALPKGRLGNQVAGLLRNCGLEADLSDLGRRLTVEDPAAGIRYFLVKPWDVPVYGDSGVADLGATGRDTLLESRADIYELLDLGLGRCRMAVAGMPNTPLSGRLRVATKYPVIAREYFSARVADARFIKLSGSVELAPILGLSDVIVDIVETGATLRANGLEVLADILPVSARLVANKASCKFKEKEIEALLEPMAQACAKEREVVA
ncbi:MAG: ATP phosphoribosyltransferase [Lawsonibacter sp.]